MASDRSLRVLVTGASGFVGSAATVALLGRRHTVVATSNVLTPELPTHPNLSWVLWDVSERPLPDVDWRALDVILHLAVPEKPFDFPKNAAVSFGLTVNATFELLEKARAHGVQRVLVASTGNVLGPGKGPAREDDVLYDPASFYGATKACAELLVRSYQPVLPTAVLRFFHPYGPGGDRFLVNRLLWRVAQGQEVTIEGKDGIALNPVWIDDLAEGVRLAVEALEPGVFHLSGPETLTLRELLVVMGAAVGREPVIRCAGELTGQRHAGACDRAAQLLGFRPTTSLREGLRRLVALRKGSAERRND